MKIEEIKHELATQDNLATSEPIFVVEARDLVVTDPDYYSSDDGVDGAHWCNSNTGEKFQRGKSEYYAALDVLKKGGLLGDEWVHLHFASTWKFVAACFTKKGAEAFIARKQHDYPDGLRIYCYSAVHNQEFIAVRNLLKE